MAFWIQQGTQICPAKRTLSHAIFTRGIILVHEFCDVNWQKSTSGIALSASNKHDDFCKKNQIITQKGVTCDQDFLIPIEEINSKIV